MASIVEWSDTDWCKNVLAAGWCTLTLNGGQHALTDPDVIPARDAEPLVRPALYAGGQMVLPAIAV